MDELKRCIDRNLYRYIKELAILIGQPSISSTGEGVSECSQLLSELMKAVGVKTRIFRTKRHPIVFGEIRSSSSTRTLLVYGHYDVQPPEPLDKWTSPPFKPEVREGRIYGRGTSDNKGQFFPQIKAVEVLNELRGDLPVNLKFLFEGEEEIGSPNLEGFVEGNKELLKADAFFRSDGIIHETGRPIVKLGQKGLLYLELSVKTGDRDFHSSRAAVLPNPVWRLVWGLSSLKSYDERILIDGFYDDIREPTTDEMEVLKNIPFEKEQMLSEWRIDRFLGDVAGTEYYKKLLLEPTCNIAGVVGGYTGANAKTVLPCEASAKMDIRLVPDQNPDDIHEKVLRHLSKNGFGDIKVSKINSIRPARTPLNNPAVDLVIKSVEQVYGVQPIIYLSSEASGPTVVFVHVLKLPVVLVPYAHPDSNPHAPNENIAIDSFKKGIQVSALVMENIGGMTEHSLLD